MVEPGTQLMLPFAVIEREGGAGQEFPLAMTLATILADVEQQREKSGLLRRREESLEFASLLYWPIVVTPWRENRHLVFDGMGVWSYVFARGRIPDAKSFAIAVNAAKDYRAIQSTLQERGAAFDAFASMENQPILGLFIHEEFMRDLLAHIALARSREVRGSPILQARLSMAHVAESVKRLHAIMADMISDIQEVGFADASAESAIGRARSDLGTKRDETGRSYTNKIDAIKPGVAAEVAGLEQEREARWSTMQPKLLELQATARKYEADLVSLEQEMRRRADPAAASRARERLDVTRRELDRMRYELQRYQSEIAQARASYDQQIQTQWERLRALERERDEEVARLHREEQAVVALATKVRGSIRMIVQSLADGVHFLESQGVPANVSETTVIQLPIFVGSFGSERGRRMVVYPPMVARAGKGVIGSLKSTLGGAVLPLEPKTHQFEQIFRGGIEKALVEDASLAALLASVGNANNLLHLANLPSLLRQGLAEMKAQGWIKDRHERELISNLERHIEAAGRTRQVP